MKQELADYLNAETDKLKAKQKRDLWARNDIQFPRLLAELAATDAFTPQVVEQLGELMDLDAEQIDELLDRAQGEWERIKQDTFFRLPSK